MFSMCESVNLNSVFTLIYFLSHPLTTQGGDVRTSSIARWKVRGRFPIRDN